MELTKKVAIHKDRASKAFRGHWQLYLILGLPIVYIVAFKYVPMYGVQIAFRQYDFYKGILGSPWIGLTHFATFFRSPMFSRLLKNTLSLSVYQLAASFPLPIILAIAINESRLKRFKKVVQTVTYAPHFISMVVFISMVHQVLSLRSGLVNNMITGLGGESVHFMGMPQLFQSIYVWSGVWQNTGYAAIIYLAALAGIDPTLHEAAIVDGATQLQRIRHIDLPGILPTIVILLILNAGQIMNVGFEKVFLLQNPLNIPRSEVIATYVYQVGLVGGNFSFSAAVGLFNSIVNFALIISVNAIAKRVGETSLW
jgi:putative aldouronate transport system permease protein